jgi:putative phosphoesterase
MLAVLSDTHGREDARLSGRTAEAVEEASEIVHAGDFMTASVLEEFESYGPVHGVSGNNDTPEVCERVPTDRVVEWRGLRIAVVHGHEHTDTALSMFGRQSNADLLVVGHSHEPGFSDDVVPTLNPGSHADPRWHRPAHAELEWDGAENAALGRLVEPSGEVFDRFTIDPQDAR